MKNIFVVEGPSGVGKDTIFKEIESLCPNKYIKIQSYTTRPKRPGEKDGVTYFFTDEKTFFEKVKSGEIFEHTYKHGTYRGICRTPIDKVLEGGKIAIKDADIIGLRALKEIYPGQVTGIFITADKDVVKKRLTERGDKDIGRRLSDYENAHKFIKEFDYVIENNGTVDKAARKVLYILEGEENGRRKTS